MQRIVLKSDTLEIEGKPALEAISDDLKLIRDIVATLTREYHKEGKDKYDYLIDNFTAVGDRLNAMTSEIEKVKNSFSRIEKESNEINSFNKILSKKIDVIQKQLSENSLSNTKSVNQEAPQGITEDSFSSLVHRVASLVKEVGELKEHNQRGLMNFFKRK